MKIRALTRDGKIYTPSQLAAETQSLVDSHKVTRLMCIVEFENGHMDVFYTKPTTPGDVVIMGAVVTDIGLTQMRGEDT